MHKEIDRNTEIKNTDIEGETEIGMCVGQREREGETGNGE